MDSSRRQQAEGYGTKARRQGLGSNIRVGSGSNERSLCNNRWHDVLDRNIERASGRIGKWAEDENSKLKDAVQTHGDKDWAAIAALVPGRTRMQCKSKCHNPFALSGRLDVRVTGHQTKTIEICDTDSR
jgi:hypothetical protein